MKIYSVKFKCLYYSVRFKRTLVRLKNSYSKGLKSLQIFDRFFINLTFGLLRFHLVFAFAGLFVRYTIERFIRHADVHAFRLKSEREKVFTGTSRHRGRI
ncbi:hypothetical protein PUN28_011519 [Cardiocondyla obscurior]|uniref:Uncharacterized protein n=1 Tax=Cardiocondyla obscurior TaxID=286306 RepID=A0AAW2FGF0_9HYME